MKILKDKRFRYGAFSTVMMLAAATIFVLVNLLAGEFDRSADLTRERLFSLTDQSRNFIAELRQDVTITFLAGAGEELPGQLGIITRITRQLLEEYEAASPHITVQHRDPLLNPALVNRFAAEAGMIDTGISAHSVVVEAGGLVRVIPPSEMIEALINPFTMAITRITQFNIEREITRAIVGVTQGYAAVVYFVTGSGEMPISPTFVSFLEAENFAFREVNLVLEDVPPTADILFIPMPGRDWSELKTDRILDYLRGEGNAFFALGFMIEEMPNLSRVLDEYGLYLTTNFVFETDSRFILPAQNLKIPMGHPHEIVLNLDAANFVNILPHGAPEMRLQNVRRQSLNISPLWSTTPVAFARSADSEAETFAQHPDDTDGPFLLAAAVHDRVFLAGTEYNTRIVVTCTLNGLSFLDGGLTAMVGEGNWHFVTNSFRWMQGRPPGVSVPVRMPPGQAPLEITAREANVLGGLAMGGLPIVSLGIGAFIWFRRRHS